MTKIRFFIKPIKYNWFSLGVIIDPCRIKFAFGWFNVGIDWSGKE